MSVLFLDCETTGLYPHMHVPWEVAVVEPDGTEHVWCWRPRDTQMRAAEPKALDIGRFRERAPLVHNWGQENRAAGEIAELVEGNVIVGSNPHFDVSMLTAWMGRHGLTWNAHYRPVCAITMAAGWLKGQVQAVTDLAPLMGEVALLGAHAWSLAEGERLEVPWRSYEVSRACGIEPPGDDEAHTALGDALWVKRLHERVTGAT